MDDLLDQIVDWVILVVQADQSVFDELHADRGRRHVQHEMEDRDELKGDGHIATDPHCLSGIEEAFDHRQRMRHESLLARFDDLLGRVIGAPLVRRKAQIAFEDGPARDFGRDVDIDHEISREHLPSGALLHVVARPSGKAERADIRMLATHVRYALACRIDHQRRWDQGALLLQRAARLQFLGQIACEMLAAPLEAIAHIFTVDRCWPDGRLEQTVGQFEERALAASCPSGVTVTSDSVVDEHR